MNVGPFPFEVSFEELEADLGSHVERIFGALESDFLVMPRGAGFIAAEVFAQGYQAIVDATDGFQVLESERLFAAICQTPIALIVLRSILGLTPPEWADVTTVATGQEVSQGYVRSLDRSVRRDPGRPIGRTSKQQAHVHALVASACEMLGQRAPPAEDDEIHRLDKVDTQEGLTSLRVVASEGVAYVSLLYERYLGRPFASHRDSVSELIGGMLEDKIETHLHAAGVPFYQTRRAEQVVGWDQNPDFFCPNYQAPIAIIEAKMTQDDGTARDKVARVLRLAAMRDRREREGQPTFDVIACISGRGFGVRENDMRSLLTATRGKVFTLSQISYVVDCTRLSDLRTVPA